MKELHHISKKTKSGIDVFVLDKGDQISSESEAMLQALHSRSTGGIRSHLKILEKTGSDNFMSRFYVGYGHKSIGDCGSVTIFIEGLSMLGAKAIQDTKLYNGQEASTRYIDFSKQEIYNPLGTDEGKKLQEEQREFYLKILPDIETHMRGLYPLSEGENEKLYESTLKAKVFDVARGFLPAGCSTNIAWHTTLRQVSDRIGILRHHPLTEIQEVAETLVDAVLEKYPNSFTRKTYADTETYLENTYPQEYYFHNTDCPAFRLAHNGLNMTELEKQKDVFNTRPNSKTELPTFLDSLGTISFEYLLDFGSFRDIQRHRAPYQKMPLLTTDIGFHQWYIDALPEHLRIGAQEHLSKVSETLKSFTLSVEEKQYYTPMGYSMSCHIMGTLPALVYLTELRSTTYVHATLRKVAIEMGEYLENNLGIKLYLDKSSEMLDLRRGKQDIKLK